MSRSGDPLPGEPDNYYDALIDAVSPPRKSSTIANRMTALSRHHQAQWRTRPAMGYLVFIRA